MDFRKPVFSSLQRLGLLAALALAIAVPAFAQGASQPIIAPQNQAFLDYVQVPRFTAQDTDDFRPGIIPEPFELPPPAPRMFMATALPATYDLRTLNKLTPIRNQGSSGSCWAFASVGSLESFLTPGESWDFSENNLKNSSGFDIGPNSGGNRAMSTAYFARWSGPVAESADPYNAASTVSPTGLPPVKHVQDVIFVPVRTGPLDNTSIKQAVITYGAVYTTYYHSNSYYNSSTASYYFNGSTNSNHAVCIVGWDDNYAASKFLATPPGNGAFLIRNSWGAYWGMSGYFWMSYYDSRLGKTENAVFTAEPATNYTNIYQYDTLGWISNMGYGGNTAWFANVFTATSNNPIVAAGLYCPAANSTYEVYVYANPTSGPISSSGPVSSSSGTVATAGYHTVKLATPAPVTSGQKFSVVVKLTTPGYGYPVALERPYSGYASKAVASAGQSYVSSGGASWSDITASYANTNVCLKAFASGSTTPTPGALSVSPTTGLSSTGVQGGPFSPASQAYTLTNTGGTAINWAASATSPWVSLSTSGGSLAAGASITLTLSVNSTANSLAAGSYSDTVTFTNATNGTGNTTRGIALQVNSATPTPGALSVSPSTGLSSSGAVGGPFSPTSATYTLTNTGGDTITWAASDTASWASLSSTGGTLAKGATAQVTASVNSAAATLAAGSYSGTVTFTNATNGTGNTTRPVSLTVTSGGVQPGAYHVVSDTFAWIDPAYHTKLALGDNATSAAISLPFAFNLYGKTYSRFYVGSNGLVGFSPYGLSYYTNTNLPNAYVPNAIICPYWDDLNPARGGGVYVGVEGAAPNRKVVVSWVDVPWGTYAPLSVRFTFQAILMEGSSDIVFQYLNVSPTNTSYGAGRSATIGIENETGRAACKFSYLTYRAVANNMAIRITNK